MDSKRAGAESFKLGYQNTLGEEWWQRDLRAAAQGGDKWSDCGHIFKEEPTRFADELDTEGKAGSGRGQDDSRFLA